MHDIPPIHTVDQLDDWLARIDAVITNGRFDSSPRRLPEKTHRDSLDRFLEMDTAPWLTARIVSYLHDIVRGGHVGVYHEYRPTLYERVRGYEASQRRAEPEKVN